MKCAFFAPAKVNLSLHVTGQRGDGYHLLDSLVAFADVGDLLTVDTDAGRTLSVAGPEAAGVPDDQRNLCLQVAAQFWSDGGFAQTLFKELPAAAGIGGGSADAAATFRAIAMGLSLNPDANPALLAAPDNMAILLEMGADIPMCVLSTASRVQGIGEIVTPFEAFPGLPAVLVNPRVAVPTGPVFQGLATKENTPMPDDLPQLDTLGDTVDFLAECRNDLEPAAQAVTPAVGATLAAIRNTAPLLARMSGSGATCFGVYSNTSDAMAGAEAIAQAHPDWWVRNTVLGSQGALNEPRLLDAGDHIVSEIN